MIFRANLDEGTASMLADLVSGTFSAEFEIYRKSETSLWDIYTYDELDAEKQLKISWFVLGYLACLTLNDDTAEAVLDSGDVH